MISIPKKKKKQIKTIRKLTLIQHQHLQERHYTYGSVVLTLQGVLGNVI